MASPSAIARLQDLIAKPGTRTHVVGGRPSWARPLALATLALGLVLGGPGQAQDTPTQGTQASATAAGDAIVIQARAVQAMVDPGAVSPVIAVGINEQGVLDQQQLFSAWSAAGLDEVDAAQLLSFAWTGGTYVQGAEGLNGDDPGRIDRAFEFLGGDIERAVPGAAVDWQQASMEWDRLTGLEEFEPETGGGASMDDAENALEKATQNAGLASLRMPLSAMADPDRMLAYAGAIETLNSDLSRISGWDGQVLGLAGRVNLSIGLDRALEKTDHRGMTSVYNDGDGLGIQGLISTVAHEWTHGVQFAVERNEFGGANAYLKPIEFIDQLQHAAPEWVQGMHDHADSAYLTSPQELMARSFEMQVELRRQDLGLVIGTELAHTPHAVSYPDMNQAHAQSGQWNTWFSRIGQLDLTGPVGSADAGLIQVAMEQATQAQAAVQDVGLSANKLGAWRQAKEGGLPSAAPKAIAP